MASQDSRLRNNNLFSCRFRKSGTNGIEEFQSLQISAVPVNPQSPAPILDDRNVVRDISNCRMFCIARKVGLAERAQYFPVEMFSTKVDMTFRITTLDTTAMNTANTNLMVRTMLNKPMLNFCHPDDVSMVREHLNKTVTNGSDVSQIYKMRGFNGTGHYVQVKSKSKLFRKCPGNDSDFIMSTHSIIGESESKSPVKYGAVPAADQTNNNLVKDGNGDEEIHEKNILLKQLLNVNFSRPEGNEQGTSGSSSTAVSSDKTPPAKAESSSSSSRILQLLSSENVPQIVTGSKRSATSASLDQDQNSPASSKSSVCKQNPALANLLAKPPHNSVAVPPPVPTKWHQVMV